MNEFDDWWVSYLARETGKAHKRAEWLYPNRALSNVAKRKMFMETFHWTMLEARTEIQNLYVLQRQPTPSKSTKEKK